MKTTTLFLILFLTGLDLWAQVPPATSPDANAPADSNGDTNEVAGYIYNYSSVTVDDLLDKVYSPLVGRTLLRAPGLPLTTPIVLKTVAPLTKKEAIEALQAVLSMNGVVIENIGDKFAKVLLSAEAGNGGQKIDTNDVSHLPDMGTFVTRIVHLNYVKPSVMQGILTPFAKLPGAIQPLEDNGILILRDNAENVKRMMEMIAQVDVGGSASEIVSEVVPIKYALAADIANALSSLGGSSANTVSIGTPPTTTTSGNGVARPGGIGNMPGGGNGVGQQSRPGGYGGAPGATPNGTPTPGGSFQSRLLSIVNRAAAGPGGQEQPIQIFGQTKIIADQRSNSLLIFATRQDMDTITNVIAKLDVLLSQVLIESAIIDVDLNKAMNMGVSAAQNPKTFSSSLGGIAGGGGFNNGPTFLNFLGGNAPTFFSTGTGTNAVAALSSGLSYFGNIGPTWDVALQAAASDSSATVIQRPRIQTSQAKAASFFVGQTVPYITGNYASYNGVAENSYSQLSVGVELDVTPFINPDGLVVMDINQEIDDIEDQSYNGTGQPSTSKRTLQSEIAVKDKDTIMLGGFIRSAKNNSKSGIPYLQDIPLIGHLFSQHTDSKDRQETIVLIRPTVLRTPDLAATQAVAEQSRLPGIDRAIAEDAADERKQVAAEAKAEANGAQTGAKPERKENNNAFLPLLPDGTSDTNQIAPANP
ncbi:MAG TPA: secretin N-terminal domain-containing protein [Verrucomicrobiae bacterium]